VTPTVGTRLVEAIAAQDEVALAACFASTASFRALTPPGLRERSGAAETAALIAAWFADSTELSLVEYGTHEIGDRLQLAYRFEGVEEGEPYVVEQQLYATLAEGVLETVDLVCSGFRPRR